MIKNVAVVFWTGTGNTEAMANAVAEGAAAAGAEARAISVADFSADDVAGYDALAFGCPAMGAEELESDEFEPVWEACKPALVGRPVALFGSYGWGGGEWMRSSPTRRPTTRPSRPAGRSAAPWQRRRGRFLLARQRASV